MLRFGLLVILLVSAQAAVRVSRKDHHNRKFTNGKIVGGRPATLGQFPYQVSLQYYSGGWIHYCGGTILDENHVLTAGQCHPVPGELAVAGITDLLSPGFEVQARTITRVVPHPEYFGLVNDVAVLTVNPPFVFNEFVGPAELPLDGQQPSTGPGACTASGWGARTWTGGINIDLLYVDIDFIDDDTCMEMWAQDFVTLLPEQNICAGVEEGWHTVCYGDSGGPLMCDADDGGRYLFGSTSWGPQECGIPERPAVWAEVPYFNDFILDQIGGA